MPRWMGGISTKFGFHRRKRGGMYIVAHNMEKFSEFINENENDLTDFPLVGGRFMWSKNQLTLALTRSDWFLVSKEWEEYYSREVQIALPCRYQIIVLCSLLMRLIGGKNLVRLETTSSCPRIPFSRLANGGFNLRLKNMQVLELVINLSV